MRCLPEGARAHDALQVSVEQLTGTASVPDCRRKPGRPRSRWLRGVLKEAYSSLHTRLGQWLMFVKDGERNGPLGLQSMRSDDDDDDATVRN